MYNILSEIFMKYQVTLWIVYVDAWEVFLPNHVEICTENGSYSPLKFH